MVFFFYYFGLLFPRNDKEYINIYIYNTKLFSFTDQKVKWNIERKRKKISIKYKVDIRNNKYSYDKMFNETIMANVLIGN